jgi:hypothetical protein
MTPAEEPRARNNPAPAEAPIEKLIRVTSLLPGDRTSRLRVAARAEYELLLAVLDTTTAERDAALAQLHYVPDNWRHAGRLAAAEARCVALAEAVEPLVAACEAEFTSDHTERGECPEADASPVALPNSHITFGLIRRARAVLAAAGSSAADPESNRLGAGGVHGACAGSPTGQPPSYLPAGSSAKDTP